MTETEIRRLVRRIKESDSQSAFRDFYNLCYDRFYRIAYYYVKNEDLAQEIVIDSFVKLWNKRSSLLSIESIEDYCFILVKNTALNYLEKESRYASQVNEMEINDNNTHSPEEDMISEELFSIYVKALDRLPERCREIFLRIREEKQTYAQIAGEMDISIKTVDAQLQKAQNRLREALLPYLSNKRK